MKASELISQLVGIIGDYGDIEVSCIGTTIPISREPLADCFETTVETLKIMESESGFGRDRLYSKQRCMLLM